MDWRASLVISALVFFSSPLSASCGSATCPINTQWESQGPWQGSGLRVLLHADYVDQDQLRQGSERIAFGSVHAHHDEVSTVNRNTVLDLDYRYGKRWGVTLTLPYVERDHRHIHNHHGQPLPENWDLGGLGDARLVARYLLTGRLISLMAGVKLPTGGTTRVNAHGDLAERSLQPGTGTTDAMLGATWYHADPSSVWSGFVGAQAIEPLGPHAGYRRGRALQLDSGLRYAWGDRVGLLLQANVRWNGRDRGPEAEPEDSGGRTVSVAPGVSFAVTPRWQAYLYWQRPIYRHVNGVQLSASDGVLTGIAAAF